MYEVRRANFALGVHVVGIDHQTLGHAAPQLDPSRVIVAVPAAITINVGGADIRIGNEEVGRQSRGNRVGPKDRVALQTAREADRQGVGTKIARQTALRTEWRYTSSDRWPAQPESLQSRRA